MNAFDNVLDQCLAVAGGEEVVLLADEGTDPDVVTGLERHYRTRRHPPDRADAEPWAARSRPPGGSWPR